MKNIQVIDNSDNCKYEIFGTMDDEFECIFPGGADVEFAEDFFDRVGEKKANEITEAIWRRRVEKKDAQGIHGTLFYGFVDIKRKFYPKKRFSDDLFG